MTPANRKDPGCTPASVADPGAAWHEAGTDRGRPNSRVTKRHLETHRENCSADTEVFESPSQASSPWESSNATGSRRPIASADGSPCFFPYLRPPLPPASRASHGPVSSDRAISPVVTRPGFRDSSRNTTARPPSLVPTLRVGTSETSPPPPG